VRCIGNRCERSADRGRHGKTIVVAKSGGAYATIQAGLNAAQPGDTVEVRAGTYNERVTFPRSGTAGKYITLRGEPGAIIDGTGCSTG